MKVRDNIFIQGFLYILQSNICLYKLQKKNLKRTFNKKKPTKMERKNITYCIQTADIQIRTICEYI